MAQSRQSQTSKSDEATPVSNQPAPRVRIDGLNASPSGSQGSNKGLEILLSVDDRVRAATSVRELQHVIVNETRKVTGARQIFLAQPTRTSGYHVKAVSSLALVERDTPLIRWIEGMIAKISEERGLENQVDFALPAYVNADADETKTYPFRELTWQPLKSTSGEIFAGLLFARERVWQKTELKVINRQGSVYANAWQALVGKRGLKAAKKLSKPVKLGIAAALLLIAAVPVPITALSPFEIVEYKPGIVTAPIDGTIADVLVLPNSKVEAGQTIVVFEDTTLRNRFEISDREMNVARTKFDRAQRAAFTDAQSRHELAITKTEFELKKAERNYAKELLDRTQLKASRSGILIYTDKNRLLGKPVTIGERLMKIGSPENIRARIDVPVADAIILEKETKVRLFFDAAPFSPEQATIQNESYHAEPNPSNQLVYRIDASLNDESYRPRIGSRGTAQIYGQNVPLIFALLHKPISSLRQYIGL